MADYDLAIIGGGLNGVSVARDAAGRGEIPPERLTPVVLEVLHALIIKRMLLETDDPTEKDITEMVDEVLLPLLVITPA